MVQSIRTYEKKGKNCSLTMSGACLWSIQSGDQVGTTRTQYSIWICFKWCGS